MVIINSYLVAVFLTIITMLCWGSWGNTQKLATKTWPYSSFFYWDFSFGILIMSLVFGITIGSTWVKRKKLLTRSISGEHAFNITGSNWRGYLQYCKPTACGCN